MKRTEFASTEKEVLTEIGENFVFEKGQVFKEKQFDDEYIIVLDVGPQVNDDTDMGNKEKPYDIRYITCDAKGMPFIRQNERGVNHHDTLWWQEKFSSTYAYVRKMPESYVEMAEDSDSFHRKYGIHKSLDHVSKPDKDRRSPEEKAQDEALEAAEHKEVMRRAGIHGTIAWYRPGADPSGTSMSDMPVKYTFY